MAGTRTWLTRSALVASAALVAAVPLPAHADNGGALSVMSQNLYLGADLFPAVEAAQVGTNEFLAAAAKVYQQAMASDFPTRADAFAKTVKKRKPDIIGLQEVTSWIAARKDPSSGPALQNQDFLAIVKKAFKANGLKYKVVGTSRNASIGPFPYVDPSVNCAAPTSILPTEWPCSIQMQDRDVLLVNTKTKALKVTKKSVKSGLFSKQQTFSVAGQTISFARGYVFADMTYKGATFRMANTHLEVGGVSEGIQNAQAKQFVKKVRKGATSVIAVGDFNTDAYGAYSPSSYRTLTGYFRDAWNVKRDGQGLSCCQNAELSNPVSENDIRIDLVLIRGKVNSKRSMVTNVTPFRATPVPLWESDHAGVFTKLRVK
jgi:endonuclease/exonuclease/phosphatase family metal-dependent hydrolase